MLRVVVTILMIFVIGEARSQIIQQYNEQTPNGYKFGYKTEDLQEREEIGTITKNKDEEILQVAGTYSYTGDDGKIYVVHYHSDEKGFRANVKIYPPGSPTEKPVLAVPEPVFIQGAAIATLAGGGLG